MSNVNIGVFGGVSDGTMTVGDLKNKIREVCDASPFLKRDVSAILAMLATDYARDARLASERGQSADDYARQAQSKAKAV